MPLRVLTVTNMYPTPDRPAYGIFVARQVDALRRAGVETDVVFIDGKRSRAAYARGVVEVRRALAREAYDLVHAHYGLSGWVGRLQRRRPLVVSYCGSDLQGAPASALPRRALHRAVAVSSRVLAFAAEAIIVKSRAMRESLPARLREEAVVIPSGVDLALFAPMPRSEAVRALEDLPEGPRILFAASPENRVKRFDLARAAVAELRRRTPEASLVVASGVRPGDMRYYYNACDVLLVTSDLEGSPNVVKEALACNLPVVSVPVGDVEERIGGLAGCHIVEREPAAIAVALEKVLSAPRPSSLRAQVTSLSDDRIAQRVLTVYRSVLD